MKDVEPTVKFLTVLFHSSISVTTSFRIFGKEKHPAVLGFSAKKGILSGNFYVKDLTHKFFKFSYIFSNSADENVNSSIL